MRLGKNQLKSLEMLSPKQCPVTADATLRRLIELGLAEGGDNGSFVCLTPAGLRVLADEIESGRMCPIRQRMLEHFERKTK